MTETPLLRGGSEATRGPGPPREQLAAQPVSRQADLEFYSRKPWEESGSGSGTVGAESL